MSEMSRRFDCSETHPGCSALRSAAQRAGVTDPDNLPFMIRPPKATSAALLVHGFTGTPWEMRPLAEFLAGAGIASLAVCLPGHGTTPEDLSRRRWEEWLESVAKGHQILTAEFPSVYGMGMSTGGLLLLALPDHHPVKGLVLFSPYLRILHKLAPWAGWVRWVRPYHSKKLEVETEGRYYSRRPVAGVHQINRLVRAVRGGLPHIDIPVLAFNGEGDQTVNIDSSRELMAELGSRVKIHEIFGPDVPHVLTGDDNPCRWSMFAQASHFVQQLEKPGEPVVRR